MASLSCWRPWDSAGAASAVSAAAVAVVAPAAAAAVDFRNSRRSIEHSPLGKRARIKADQGGIYNRNGARGRPLRAPLNHMSCK